MPRKRKYKPRYNLGAPTKYKRQYADDLLEFMCEGYPFDAFPGLLYRKYKTVTASLELIYGWLEQHPEFSRARQDGEQAGYHWWLNQGRRGMSQQLKRIKKEVYEIDHKTGDKKLLTQEWEPAMFQGSVFSMFMRNLYKDKWSDQRDHRFIANDKDGKATPLVIKFSRDKEQE